MKNKISLIYMVVFVLAVMGLGISKVLVGDIFNEQIIFSILFVLGAGLVIAITLLEKRTIVIIPKETKETEEPQVEKKKETEEKEIKIETSLDKTEESIDNKTKAVMKYIKDKLEEGNDIGIIGKALQEGGYKVDYLNQILNKMVTSGMIKIEKQPEEIEKAEEPQVKEKKELEERKIKVEEQVVEEIKVDEETEEKETETPQEEDTPEESDKGIVCPLCNKQCKNDQSFKIHFGKDHRSKQNKKK